MTATRYHHGNLREALAQAAVEAAREHGPDGLAIRELARRVGVSHNAAYRHFADREALVDVVAQVAMQGLTDAMARRQDDVDRTAPDDVPPSPQERARARLRATGLGYVDYALAEPGLFRVLFTAYPEAPDATPDADDPFGRLNLALDEMVEVGALDPARRPGAEIACWSAVHGFSMLLLEGPLRGLDPDTRTACLDVLLDTLDRGHPAA